jgi:hypothetical protein
MADERTLEVARSADPGEGQPARLERLRRLLRSANDAQGDARGALATEVNQLLATLGAPGEEATAAEELVAQLDAHWFDNLFDEYGVSSRRRAVQTLLGFGFPHALKVDPVDLDFMRGEEAREKKRFQGKGPVSLRTQRLQSSRTLAMVLSVSFGTLLGLWSLVAILSGSAGVGYWGLVQVLLSVGSTVYLSQVMPPVEQQTAPMVGVATGLLVAVSLIPAAGLAAVIATFGSAATLVTLYTWKVGSGA